MDRPFKGGQGNKAPYKTTHLRVPEPIAAELFVIVNNWRRAVAIRPEQPQSAVKTYLEYELEQLRATANIPKVRRADLIKRIEWFLEAVDTALSERIDTEIDRLKR